ncbi:protoporphyrinogen oxidase HemJ [Legionella maceachernii]|uniref:Protoporphyrinogen IX oxidase n=1 Tax=Legionella maceachernii TaxID=466 RepID=A0A0W0W8U1_9GAMM|nr:protoporphyrinogen oxidase HemJ [Legionella maceachernii]KTD28785.1 transmembrane protein [Legionella maceachernii]SJZ70924.1 putative membrane protein [Legionella maceachernii]SUP02321.1 Predicted membrane protein [Legionella maceachernii]
MLVIKAFHIIAMVAWFAGLFYLPRLFVYHADAMDQLSIGRFKIMERRLYYGITWPAALITTFLGVWLTSYNWQYYLKAPWFHAKLSLVILVWVYHLTCGHFLKQFAQDKNRKRARFYRIFNELPTVLLMGIVLLVVVKP